MNGLITIAQNSDLSILGNRNRSIDYNNIIMPFQRDFRDNQNAFLNSSTQARIHNDLAGQGVIALNGQIGQLTKAGAEYLNASAGFFESNLAFASQVFSIFQSQGSTPGLGLAGVGRFLQGIADLAEGPLGSVIDFLVDIPGNVLDALKSVGSAVLDFLSSALGQFLNSVGGFALLVASAAMGGLALVGVVYLLVAKYSAPPAAASVATTTAIATAAKRHFNKITSENAALRAELNEIRAKVGLPQKVAAFQSMHVADGSSDEDDADEKSSGSSSD